MKQIDEFILLCIERLKEETPRKTGLTSNSWTYSIDRSGGDVKVYIENLNVQNGINIAILLDTGHATKDGQYISGLHFIDPIINDTFKEIIEETWKELNRS